LSELSRQPVVPSAAVAVSEPDEEFVAAETPAEEIIGLVEVDLESDNSDDEEPSEEI
jgi:hypothetical protein